MKKLNNLEQEQVTGGIPIHPSSTENHHPKSFITPKPYIYPNVYAETGMSELRDEAIGQVNGGICWPVKYGVDLSKPQCGSDGNNGCPGGGIYREEILEPVDCSGLIP